MVPRLDDEPADQRRIHLHVHPDLRLQPYFQLPLQVLLLRLRQGKGAAHFQSLNILKPVDFGLELLPDRKKEVQPMFFNKQKKKPFQERRRVFPERRMDQALFLLRRDKRMGQNLAAATPAGAPRGRTPPAPAGRP